MSKPDLNSFIAHLKSTGLAVSQHFIVHIPDFGSEIDQVMCEATSLPGMQLMSTEIRTAGEYTAMPHAPMFAQQQLTFISDGTLNIRKNLEKWFNQVYNVETRSLGYYDDYVRDVTIFVTNKEDKVIYACVLREAWIQSISDSQLSYADGNVIRIPVTLTYKWWDQLKTTGGQNEPTEQVTYGKSVSDATSGQNVLTGGVPGSSIGQETLTSSGQLIQTEAAGNSTGIGLFGNQQVANPRVVAAMPTDIQSALYFAQETSSTVAASVGQTVNSAANSIQNYNNQNPSTTNVLSILKVGCMNISRDTWQIQQTMQQLTHEGVNTNPTPYINALTQSSMNYSNTLENMNAQMIDAGYDSPFGNSIEQFTQIRHTPQSLSSQIQNIGCGVSTAGAELGRFTQTLYNSQMRNTSVMTTLMETSTQLIEAGNIFQAIGQGLNRLFKV